MSKFTNHHFVSKIIEYWSFKRCEKPSQIKNPHPGIGSGYRRTDVQIRWLESRDPGHCTAVMAVRIISSSPSINIVFSISVFRRVLASLYVGLSVRRSACPSIRSLTIQENRREQAWKTIVLLVRACFVLSRSRNSHTIYLRLGSIKWIQFFSAARVVFDKCQYMSSMHSRI